MSHVLSNRQIWLMPVVLLLLSMIDLLSSLLGDDWWDVVSWGTLGYTVAVILWFVLKPTS